MAEEKQSGSMTADALEAHDVLANSEPWIKEETQLVAWSFAVAVLALVVGLLIVPTSIFH